jgi:hypothetical protein
MIVTVTRNIPQQASVQTVGLQPSPLISTPMPMVSEVGLVGVPGPPGPQGPPGGSTSLWEYNYAAGSTPPPSSGTFRSDGADPPTSTMAWVNRIDYGGADRKPLLMLGKVGDQFYVQDINNSDAFAVYTLNADAVDSGSYITFSLDYVEGAGALTGNLRCLIGVVVAGPAGPPGQDGTIIHVGPTAPPSPALNDLWVDTS